MYGIVTPVLYREPVVQDLGLFLKGIQRPMATGTTIDHAKTLHPAESVPLHKIHALALVKSLHLVHASSRHAITPNVTTEELEDPDSDTNDDYGRYVRDCHTKSLADSDINGWNKANNLIYQARKVHGRPFSILQGIVILTLGQWDDGRWDSYAQLDRDERHQYHGTGRGGSLDSSIKQIFRSTGTLHQTLRAKQTCGRLPNGRYSNPPLYADQTGIAIVHASNIQDIRMPRPFPAHVRLYVNIAIFKPYRGVLDISMNMVQSAMDPYTSYDRLLYYVPDRTKGEHTMETLDAIDTVVELCIVTEEGNKEHHDLALKVKRAYERYITHTAQSKGTPCGGELRILVGDQVPVCPCCGVA